MSEESGALTKKQIVMVTVLLVGAALSVLNQTSVSPMLPAIMQELSVSSPTAQWLVSGFSLVSAVVIPVSAYMMKRFSTRSIFFASIAFFVVGCILCFAAPVFPVLMAGRICQAICAGMLMPLATNIMLLVFPPEKRGIAMGIYSLITSLMPAVGPSVAGGLTDSVGWRMVYVIMMVLATLVAVIALASLRNYGKSERVPLDVPSVILSALGLVGVLYGISSMGDAGFTPFSIGLVVAGVVILALFVWRQTRLAEPVLNMDVFRFRRFVIGLGTVMIVMIVCGAPAVTLPLVVQEGLGESASVAGLMTIPASIIGAVTALVAGRLFDRMGGRHLAIAGAVILVAAYAGCALFPPSMGIPWLTVCMALSNLGMMLVTIPLNTWSLGYLPDELIPHGNAMSNTLRQVAMSVSVTLFVTIMAVASTTTVGADAAAAVIDGSRIAFWCQTALCVLVLVLVVAFVRPGEEAATEEAQSHDTDPANARARDFMRIEVPFLTSDATVRKAMELFNREGITDSPVVDEKGRVAAFLSSSDIMRQLVERKMLTPDMAGWSLVADNESLRERLSDIIDRNVMGIATRNVVTVSIDDTLEHVCSVLAQRRFKKVPVVDGDRLAGTVNRDDIVHHIMHVLAKESI